ncbi:hypothetical protein [Paracoccus marinaquae]|uniref:hypothetical protein n=1 Tax=Paracoccus marinaquae TaxID=2841926 RepID=UPI001C07F873|nr:hypothetical protein [Paracoccus marinaquae]
MLSLIENLPVGPKDGYRTIRSVLAGGAGMASIVAGLKSGKLKARRLAGRPGISGLQVLW